MKQGNPGGQQPQMNVDLTTTEGLLNSKGKNVFESGVILRKISKFITGTDSDAVMPIPVFFDPESGKILRDTIPADLREEYEDLIAETV